MHTRKVPLCEEAKVPERCSCTWHLAAAGRKKGKEEKRRKGRKVRKGEKRKRSGLASKHDYGLRVHRGCM